MSKTKEQIHLQMPNGDCGRLKEFSTPKPAPASGKKGRGPLPISDDDQINEERVCLWL